MQDRKHVAWLYGQLPDLLRDGTIDADSASRIRSRYGDVEEGGQSRAIVLFGILGAALIGGGIILLIAHNWDGFGRPLRAALSLAPLLLGQGLVGWTLARRPESVAWREGAGTFLTLAIGASIALVAQTYHTGGRFEDFLLSWVILGLPVAYLLRATLPAILYLVGIVSWAGINSAWTWDQGNWGVGEALGYWGLLALAMPWWFIEMREGRYGPRVALFGWTLALTLPIGFAISLGKVTFGFAGPVWHAAFWTTLFLAGAKWWPHATSPRQRPLLQVGALGAVGVALVLTFGDAWREHPTITGSLAGYAIPLAWLAASLALWADALKRRDVGSALLGSLPVVACAGYAVSAVSPWLAAAAFNLYVFALGVGVLVIGLRAQRLAMVNAGMMILSALILIRFFDVDIGFVARGVAFIVIGAGFLLTNVMLLRKRRAAQ
ncbi:MAG: hypothetical protein CTY15_08980 [Methylocystis sp.]|nr:MAG: hypothetical protein CTY15_08980 [Methylocystis sp.]